MSLNRLKKPLFWRKDERKRALNCINICKPPLGRKAKRKQSNVDSFLQREGIISVGGRVLVYRKNSIGGAGC